MCDGVLIKNPDGTEFCLPLYREVLRWRIPPDPGPFGRVFEDIATLATINQAIAHLADERVRVQLGQVVQESFKAVSRRLPAGVSIGDGLTKAPTAYSTTA
jgi:hypothetical protein